MSSKFEIKVALLGFVSVGKTTVLNALLRDKFSEVSARRTTAAVNFFRLSYCNSKQKVQDGDGKDERSPSEGDSMEWSVVADGTNNNAEATLEQIAADNKAFRESNQVHEKNFHINIDEEICEMRKDTTLVLVDIPGVNEAGVGGKYRQYVEDKWDTFDAAIVVMDGRQGVNTEEQVNLLEFVKKNSAQKKNIPIVILCNKVDDPDDEEQQLLIKEARLEVQRVFGVNDREKALEQLLTFASSGQPSSAQTRANIFPVFIPTSAIHAFIYQTASLMTLEQFKKFDKELVDKLGREEVGRWKWKKMRSDQKYKAAHETVSDPSRYRERLESTNFDKFLKALSFAIGGSDTQLALIQKQLDVALKNLSPRPGIAEAIRLIYERRQLLGKDTIDLKLSFWSKYVQFEDKVFGLLRDDPTNVASIAGPAAELVSYVQLAQEIGWKEECAKVFKAMKAVIRRQVSLILEKECLERNRQLYIAANDESAHSWKTLTQETWKTILGSICLALSHNTSLCGLFGREKLLLESLVQKITASVPYSCQQCMHCVVRDDQWTCYHPGHQSYSHPHTMPTTSGCTYCGKRYTKPTCSCLKDRKEFDKAFELRVIDSKLEPVHKQEHDRVFQVKVPDSFEDVNHWGHVAWKLCSAMKTLNLKQCV